MLYEVITIVDVELEDPDYLVGTFRGSKELLYAPHLQLFP